MCCETDTLCGHGRFSRQRAAWCGDDENTRFGPCFSTRDEKIAWLEEHLKGLQKDTKAVEERIAKMRKEE
jgi:hypothetical protein